MSEEYKMCFYTTESSAALNRAELCKYIVDIGLKEYVIDNVNTIKFDIMSEIAGEYVSKLNNFLSTHIK